LATFGWVASSSSTWISAASALRLTGFLRVTMLRLIQLWVALRKISELCILNTAFDARVAVTVLPEIDNLSVLPEMQGVSMGLF